MKFTLNLNEAVYSGRARRTQGADILSINQHFWVS